VGQWTLREYNAATSLDNILNTARGTGGTAALRATNTVPSIRYNDPSNPNNGSHGIDATAFPGDTPNVNDDDYGAFASVPLTITAANAGVKTFVMFADDENAMRVLNSAGVPVALLGIAGNGTDQRDSNGDAIMDEFGDFNGCCNDYFGKYDLAAGNYTIEAAFKEGGGGSGFFIYGANGNFDTFNTNDFGLLGSLPAGPTTPAGLQLVPEPGTFGLLGLGALGLLARRRRRA
jgi:hypothetical protein